MKQAVIDLGTNTFHLIIVGKQTDGTYQALFRESRPAKIGQSGINQGFIAPDAIERALTVLRYFREVVDTHGIAPDRVVTIGTSAIRVAGNQAEFMGQVWATTGFKIQVISGEQEAEYIYHGVRASGALGSETALIMDIGGGSVEFIIGNKDRIFWKQSFEIGGQRLRERFMTTDPISNTAIRRLNDYFQEQLMPLVNAVHQYSPAILVGSSGTFDTLIDMKYMHECGHWPEPEQSAFELPLAEFYRSYELLITRTHEERRQLPGMIELRVDMIVVAVCLIDYVLNAFKISNIKVSTYALKEGVLAVSPETGY